MDFSLIADYADVLAALGIIASLVFVALQVRQNTHQLKNAHLESSIDRDTVFFSRAYDPRTAAIVVKGRQSYGSLDDVERLAFQSWMREFITTFATTFLLARQGLLRPQQREMLDQRLRLVFGHQGAMEWWRAADRVPLPADIVARIDELVQTN